MQNWQGKNLRWTLTPDPRYADRCFEVMILTTLFWIANNLYILFLFLLLLLLEPAK